MDKRNVLNREQAFDIVREYKRVISPRFQTEPLVLMYVSYAKGYARTENDIDVAVIVPHIEGN